MISGLLFLAAFLGPLADDIGNFFFYGPARGDLQLLQPHTNDHVLTGAVGGFLGALLMAIPVVLGPYRRGERWAWWALALPGILVLFVKIWGTAVIQGHAHLGFPPPAFVLTVVVWVAAAALSWSDTRQVAR